MISRTVALAVALVAGSAVQVADQQALCYEARLVQVDRGDVQMPDSTRQFMEIDVLVHPLRVAETPIADVERVPLWPDFLLCTTVAPEMLRGNS